MMCILEFVQGERTNVVGVFQSHEHAVSFLQSIPSLREQTDAYGTSYFFHYQDLPDGDIIRYRGWQYVFSRFSYSAYESAGDIEALLHDVCFLDEKPPESDAFVQGMTTVDAYSCENSDVLATIAQREAFYKEAKTYYAAQGRKIARDGLGSEDGEYVLVERPDKPAEMHLSFLLDPQTIAAWKKAGSFEKWLKTCCTKEEW
ncbi:MAG: hypothetical protein RSF73_09520 [Ruthenibacterium sp.]